MRDGGSGNPDDFSPDVGLDFGDALAEDLRTRVKAELEPGERLLWTARSSPPPARTGKGYFIAFGIGLLLAGCGVVVIFDAYGLGRLRPRIGGDAGTGLLLMLVGCVTAALTIAVRIGEGIKRDRLAHTYYAVTDRRAIWWMPESKDGSIRVRSLTRGRIQDVARVERPDGTGNLEFTLPPGSHEYVVPKELFQHIPEVRRVEQLVRNHLATAETTS